MKVRRTDRSGRAAAGDFIRAEDLVGKPSKKSPRNQSRRMALAYTELTARQHSRRGIAHLTKGVANLWLAEAKASTISLVMVSFPSPLSFVVKLPTNCAECFPGSW